MLQMIVRSSGPVLVLCALAGACKSKDSGSGGDAPPPAEARSEDAGTAAPAAAPPTPIERLETDPLWKLAGAPVKLGAVFADGALAEAGAGLRELERILAAQPGGKELWRGMTARLRGKTGFDLHDVDKWDVAGLDPERGAALFATADDRVAVVLPVGDLETHRDFFGLTRKEKDGRELDYSAKMGYCLEAGGRYLCSEHPELLVELAAGEPGSLARRALGLPEELRGSLEVVADLSAFPGARDQLADLKDALTGIGLLAVAVRFESGRLTAEGWMAGQRSGRIGEAFRTLPAGRPLAPHAAGATGVMAVRLPLRELIPPAEVPPAMPAGNLDLKPILFEQMTGQMAMISAGTGLTAGTLLLGLADEKPLASALPQLCALMGPLASDARFESGSCRAEVRGESLPIPGMPSALRKPLRVALTTAPGAALMHVGEPRRAASPPPAFVDGEAHVLGWGRSLDPLATAPAALGALLSGFLDQHLGAEERTQLRLVRWLANHVYEAGIRGRLDPDGIRVSLLVASFAADPDAAYAAYQEAIEALVGGDVEAYRGKMKALAAAHPDTLAAEQAALVEANAPALGLGTAIYAAIGIPAFLKYTAKPRLPAEAPPHTPSGPTL